MFNFLQLLSFLRITICDSFNPIIKYKCDLVKFPKKHKTSDNKEKYLVFDQEKLKEYMKKNLYWEIMDNETTSNNRVNKTEVKDYMHLMFDVEEVKIGKKCIKKFIVPDSDDSDGSDT